MTLRLYGMYVVLTLGLPCSAPAADLGPADSASGATLRVAAKDDDLPLSKDALFGGPSEGDKAEGLPSDGKKALPDSKESLFGTDSAAEKAGQSRSQDSAPGAKEALIDVAAEPAAPIRQGVPDDSRMRGYFQGELARTVAHPDHWSKALGRLELGTQGRFGESVQWKVSGRIDFNGVYDLTDFYQSQVRDDQRAEFQLRETYLDYSSGGWDWRLGRQHIVWGEMVGLFFADVVSAKDLRDFVLPDFQVMRIPQWAARTEYFDGDFHTEFVWIPFPSYDRLGKPADFSRPGYGADYYPYPPSSLPMTILAEDKPGTGIDHSNFGMRVTQLTRGWDLSGFYYTSMNSYPTWYRDPVVKTRFTPKHDRIWQLGGTLGKDFGDFVLKAEAVYTNGRRPNLVSNLADEDGVVKQNTLDWAVGLDFNPGPDTRVNTQLYQSLTFDHEADTIPDKAETGVSLLVSHGLPGNWRAEVLLVHSLNRSDWMLRPKASWGFQPNWKLTFGLDLFDGSPDGLFGQYDHQDRAYAEVRYDF